MRKALVFEVGIWASLLRWVLRRPRVGDADEPVTYHRAVAPVMWLWIFASAAEVVVLDLVLPWHTVRVVAAVLGLWGLAWMVGLLGSYVVHPHLVTPEGLRVRSGFRLDLLVPWADIASVAVQEHDLPSSMRALHVEEDTKGHPGACLGVGVSGRTNVLVRLDGPSTVTVGDAQHRVTAVRLWADEHRALVGRVRTAVAASA